MPARRRAARPARPPPRRPRPGAAAVPALASAAPAATSATTPARHLAPPAAASPRDSSRLSWLRLPHPLTPRLGDQRVHLLQLVRGDALTPQQAQDELRRSAVEDAVEKAGR